MNTTKKDLTILIKEALKESATYEDYYKLCQELSETEKTTGEHQTEALINYTKLNARRMKRWSKTVKISEEAITEIKKLNTQMTWLVLSESWCGDAAHILPVLDKIVSSNKNIQLKIILRDEHLNLMSQFLTNGNQSIPKLIALDQDHKVRYTYGPRPTTATKMVQEYKETHGALTPEFKEELQRWYNKDKGQTIIKDLIAQINTIR